MKVRAGNSTATAVQHRRKVGAWVLGVGLLVAVVSACGGSSDSSEAQDVPYTRTAIGVLGGSNLNNEPQGFLARTPAEATSAVQAAETPTWVAGFPFSSNVAVIVTAGVQPNPGYGVQVLSVQRSGDTLNVAVRVQPPTAGEVFPEVLSVPYLAIQAFSSDVKGVTQVSVTRP
jgi:hypothetical protein